MLLHRLDMETLCQVIYVVGNTVGQLAVFAVVPNLFNRIQFRRISREPLDIALVICLSDKPGLRSGGLWASKKASPNP